MEYLEGALSISIGTRFGRAAQAHHRVEVEACDRVLLTIPD